MMDPNCKIIELEKMKKDVLHEIGILQRKRSDLSIAIIEEWQFDRGKDATIESQPESASSEGSEQPD